MDRLDQLIEAAIAGTADAADLQEFGQLLEQPECRRRVGEAMRLCGGLAVLGRQPRRVRRDWRRWPILLAAACLALAIGLAAWASLRDDMPAAAAGRVVAAAPEARILGDRPRPAVAGVTLSAGEVLSGSCTLELPDGSRCTLSGDARLRLPGPTAPLGLDHGRMEVQAARQPADRRLAVRTARLEASVIGTRFAVDVGIDDDVVAVLEGVVRVAVGTSGADLAAGSALSSDGTVVRQASLPPSDVSLDLAAPSVPVVGQAVDGGLAPQFDHVAGGQRMHLLRVGSDTSPLASLRADSRLSLIHELPKATKAVVIVGIIRATDGREWVGNLRQEITLAAGRPAALELELAAMPLATGKDRPVLRGDEAIAWVMVLVSGGDRGLRLCRLGLSAPAR